MKETEILASFFVKSNKNHDYKNQKYIYHLTTFENLSSILKHGWVCQEFCVNRFNKQHRIAA